MPWNERTKRRLKLRDLDILMTIIETGSMGKAADRLNLSQPAVSKAMAELEAAIGVQLLDRSRRGVVPTTYGVALGKRSIAIFNDLRQGFRRSISSPIRHGAKSASGRPTRSCGQSLHRSSIDYLGNTRRCSFTSFRATRRRSTGT